MLLRDLTFPDKPASKTFIEINKVLQEHFTPSSSIIAERFRFHKREQKQLETVSAYIAALRKLSEHCAFGQFLNDALRDRFVCGLASEPTQKKLLSERNLTLEKALDITLAMESANRDANELQGKPVFVAKKIGVKPSVTLNKWQGKETYTQKEIKCYRCGATDGHKANTCRHINTKCLNCGKMGHLRVVCLQKSASNYADRAKATKPDRKFKLNCVRGPVQNPPETDLIAKIKVLDASLTKEVLVKPSINGHVVTMELDTGSPVGIMPYDLYKQTFSTTAMQKSNRKFTNFDSSMLEVRGVAEVVVTLGQNTAKLPLYVVKGGGTALFGREWLNTLCPGWSVLGLLGVNHIGDLPPEDERLQQLLKQNEQVFSEKLGKLTQIKARINLRADARPVFCKSRVVPYSLRDAVDKELGRLEEEGVITPVTHSEWATPIVPVLKPDGSVRICGDFKTTVNKFLIVDQYPLPKVEDLFSNLAGGKLFSKVDLRQAFHQMELEEQSRDYLVINTNKGLFRYNRLVFGISSAPAIWQRTMEQVFQSISGIQILQDDILITGKNTEEHFKNLQEILKRLQQFGLRANRNKCEFFKKSVEFCGHVVDAKGLHKTDKKIEVVTRAPIPTDVSELRSFLGLVNYYGKFLPSASTLLNPLHKLLEKNNKFAWNKRCEESFKAIKEAIASEKVLIHYDPLLPLRLACDASPVGIGCVLSHVLEDGTERPISFASRTLSKAERNYAQIDREALAIVWGIKKFYIYLFGRHFTLVTDHEPLTSIFHPHKSISQTAAARLQRYALFLMGFNYDIICKKLGQHGNADALSRLPIWEEPEINDEVTNEALHVFHIGQLSHLPVAAETVKKETIKDPTLSAVYNTVLQGWGSKSPDRELLSYFQRRHELSIQQGVLMWGIRVVIPEKLQAVVLKELHSGHGGIVKMKSLARSYVWWPKIDEQIQEVTRVCEGCSFTQNMPKKAPLHPWEPPQGPWRRIHADFAGPFLNHMFLVLQDAHSKWPEVAIMGSTTSEKTIEVMREVFARNGLPEVLVTDNGTQFTSQVFQNFVLQNGICHKTSPPFHPSTNGLAERFVETLKNALKAMVRESELTLSEKISKLLMAYRNTPHATTRECPSALFFNRHIRTRLDLLKPKEYVKWEVQEGKTRRLQVGQEVLARNYWGKEKWSPGIVSSCSGPLTYTVKLKDGRVWRRHVNQLLKSGEAEPMNELPNMGLKGIGKFSGWEPKEEPVAIENSAQEVPEAQSDVVAEEDSAQMMPMSQATGCKEEGTVGRYPKRDRKAPQRLITEM